MSCKCSSYLLSWRRFLLESADPQQAQAVLMPPTSSGLHWKRGSSLCQAGSVGKQDLVVQWLEATPQPRLMDSGLLGSG